jgi:hypothetical protein
MIAVGTEMIEKLGQDLVSRDQWNGPDLLADLDGSRVPLVFTVRKRHPIQGIGEDTPHRVGRFGVPYR